MKTILTFVIGISIVVLIWAGFAWYHNEYVARSLLKFPTPIETFQRLYDLFFNDVSFLGYSIYEHIKASLTIWFTAFILAAATGIFLGVVIGYNDKLYPVGMVPVNVFQMIPGLAWLPIALLLVGLGNDGAIFIIYAVSSMVITVNVAGGIRRMPPVIKRASMMMGAKSYVYFLKVLLPYSVIDIITGLRVGMSSAWRVLIAAEMIVGTGVGLGFAISMTRGVMDYTSSFACIVIICIIGLIIDKVIFVKIEAYARHKMGMEGGS